MLNFNGKEFDEKVAEQPVQQSKRKSVVWRCSKGLGAGKYLHNPCGALNAIWTIFDPNIGGNRKRRWLGHCKHCPKVTAINPEAGNIVAVFDTRKEGEEWAASANAARLMRVAAQDALESEIGGATDE